MEIYDTSKLIEAADKILTLNVVEFKKKLIDGISKECPRKFFEELPTAKITRVEVIGETGREYVNWHSNNEVLVSLQDDGKTLKVFISDKKDEFELAYCPYCLQMTNHLNNVCQKHNNNV